ncbi:hypothetical protein APHAL10511_008649 [Amanita phalloides]|nr:hypothetical protein APHAL10511_008649 [Amanita phalloides]
MSLRRVGGKEDGGIDLQGWWWLPPSASELSTLHESRSTERRRLRVIVQCKAEKKKTSPKYVRELEGVMLRNLALSTGTSISHQTCRMNHSTEDPLAQSQYPLVAMLVSESPFTKSTLLCANSSPLPLFLLHIPPVSADQRCVSGDPAPNSKRKDVNQTLEHGSAFWNSALAGPRGVLGGEMEMRWERSASGNCGRPGIWWRNQRLASWVPDHDVTLGETVSHGQKKISIHQIPTMTNVRIDWSVRVAD